MLERLTTAKHIEVVQERTGTLADVKLEDDPPSQTLEKIRLEEWRNLVKLFNWWQLKIIAAKEHKAAMETELGEYVQERGLCHKYLVDAKRAVEESLLNPVLQPAQSFCGVELAHAT